MDRTQSRRLSYDEAIRVAEQAKRNRAKGCFVEAFQAGDKVSLGGWNCRIVSFQFSLVTLLSLDGDGRQLITGVELDRIRKA